MSVICYIVPIVPLSRLQSKLEIFIKYLEHYPPEISCEFGSSATDSLNIYILLLGCDAMTQNPFYLVLEERERSVEKPGLLVALRNIGKGLTNERVSPISDHKSSRIPFSLWS